MIGLTEELGHIGKAKSMARVAPITDDESDPVVSVLFRGARRLLGRVPNATRVRARVPIATAWLLPYLVSIQREGAGGRLDGRTKEIVVLATSVANACEYCVTHNRALGEAAGLSTTEIAAIEDPALDSGVLTEKDRAVVRWSEAVTRNEAARDERAFEDLKKWFTDDEIVEITMLSAHFNMTNRVHEALQIDLEPQEEVEFIRRSAKVSQREVRSYVRELLEVLDAQDPPAEDTRGSA